MYGMGLGELSYTYLLLELGGDKLLVREEIESPLAQWLGCGNGLAAGYDLRVNPSRLFLPGEMDAS